MDQATTDAPPAGDPFRLLRSSERLPIGSGRMWHGLGQMQPVIMGWERGRITLRIEDVEGDRPCWRVLPLPWNRTEAKRLFAELESCHREGTRTPASRAWEEVRRRERPRESTGS